MEASNLIQLPDRGLGAQYRALDSQIKALNKKKQQLKELIFKKMDMECSDTISLGEFRAERKLQVHERVDLPKVHQILGRDNTPVKQIEVIKLVIV